MFSKHVFALLLSLKPSVTNIFNSQHNKYVSSKEINELHVLKQAEIIKELSILSFSFLTVQACHSVCGVL